MQCSYSSHPALTISDHKPVSAIYDVKVRWEGGVAMCTVGGRRGNVYSGREA